MNILDVQQDWSSLLSNYIICDSCKFLYREADQKKTGECPGCKAISYSGPGCLDHSVDGNKMVHVV